MQTKPVETIQRCRRQEIKEALISQGILSYLYFQSPKRKSLVALTRRVKQPALHFTIISLFVVWRMDGREDV